MILFLDRIAQRKKAPITCCMEGATPGYASQADALLHHLMNAFVQSKVSYQIRADKSTMNRTSRS